MGRLSKLRRRVGPRNSGPDMFRMHEAELFDYLPTVKAALGLINQIIRFCQLEYPVMIQAGKFSPEARRYLVNRLDVLIKVATKLRNDLEARE